ncbi:hypothetical protein K1719_009865 [Acacia pycnantha]|nr:hypothetical protein K1719_009865 [Acacia pycnantha]
MVLKAGLSLSTEYVKPLNPEFPDCHPNISNARRYFPYFKNAIGAIDGTHISCVVSESEHDRFVGRKGYPTQNIMAVCDWDMCFTYVLAGWEGTAHDARLFKSALTNPRLNFPHPPQDVFASLQAHSVVDAWDPKCICQSSRLVQFRMGSLEVVQASFEHHLASSLSLSLHRERPVTCLAVPLDLSKHF